MTTQETTILISSIAATAAALNIIITFRYRRKDIYNQLLKEQIAAGYQVMEQLLNLTKQFNDCYTKFVGIPFSDKMINTGQSLTDSEFKVLQTNLLIHLEPQFSAAFNNILSRGFIFPQPIQKIIVGYFEHISDLFENKNNSELGISLKKLYNYVADITYHLNHYFKIDKLSKQMNKLL